MKSDRKKTKVMVCSKYSEINNIKMDENALKQVPKFKCQVVYLQKMGKIKTTYNFNKSTN